MLSSNPGLTALVIVFVVGALLFALGTFMVRRESQAQTPVECRPELVEGALELRLDRIERLAMVGQPWCIEQLEREFLTDADEHIRKAAEDALLVIGARGA